MYRLAQSRRLPVSYRLVTCVPNLFAVELLMSQSEPIKAPAPRLMKALAQSSNIVGALGRAPEPHAFRNITGRYLRKASSRTEFRYASVKELMSLNTKDAVGDPALPPV